MQKRTRSILEELESLHVQRDAKHIIESRADNIIASATNLLELVAETYGSESAAVLEKKLFNSINKRNFQKFKSGLERIDANFRTR